MTERPLLAVLPRNLKPSDEIILKGKVKNGANEFSVNFAMESSPEPAKIAYHFKTDFANNVVVHNSKNCTWGQEIVEENQWIGGPEFTLTFHFDETEIIIYSGDEMREMQYRFYHQLPMSTIQTVQVWGDVDYVNEVTFRYAVQNF